MDLSAHIRRHALAIPGKQQLIMTAFAKALEIIQVPERVIQFRVVWEDDQGRAQVNRGYRVQVRSPWPLFALGAFADLGAARTVQLCARSVQGRPAPPSLRQVRPLNRVRQ